MIKIDSDYNWYLHYKKLRPFFPGFPQWYHKQSDIYSTKRSNSNTEHHSWHFTKQVWRSTLHWLHFTTDVSAGENFTKLRHWCCLLDMCLLEFCVCYFWMWNPDPRNQTGKKHEMSITWCSMLMTADFKQLL